MHTLTIPSTRHGPRNYVRIGTTTSGYFLYKCACGGVLKIDGARVHELSYIQAIRYRHTCMATMQEIVTHFEDANGLGFSPESRFLPKKRGYWQPVKCPVGCAHSFLINASKVKYMGKPLRGASAYLRRRWREHCMKHHPDTNLVLAKKMTIVCQPVPALTMMQRRVAPSADWLSTAAPHPDVRVKDASDQEVGDAVEESSQMTAPLDSTSDAPIMVDAFESSSTDDDTELVDPDLPPSLPTGVPSSDASSLPAGVPSPTPPVLDDLPDDPSPPLTSSPDAPPVPDDSLPPAPNDSPLFTETTSRPVSRVEQVARRLLKGGSPATVHKIQACMLMRADAIAATQLAHHHEVWTVVLRHRIESVLFELDDLIGSRRPIASLARLNQVVFMSETATRHLVVQLLRDFDEAIEARLQQLVVDLM